MPTFHYVENQGKLIVQSPENGQKPRLGQFLDDFGVKYFQVSFKLKVIFRPNFRLKTKKNQSHFWKKYQNVWFWANLETFLQISLNQEFFSKIQLCHFSNSPLTSCKKFLELFLRKLPYQPTNQPIITNKTLIL